MRITDILAGVRLCALPVERNHPNISVKTEIEYSHTLNRMCGIRYIQVYICTSEHTCMQVEAESIRQLIIVEVSIYFKEKYVFLYCTILSIFTSLLFITNTHTHTHTHTHIYIYIYIYICVCVCVCVCVCACVCVCGCVMNIEQPLFSNIGNYIIDIKILKPRTPLPLSLPLSLYIYKEIDR